MTSEARPLLSVQSDDREVAQLPVYSPPTKRAWTSIFFDAVGLVGFGAFAAWSWIKGGNKETSIVSTVAAVYLGGKTVLDFSTAMGLRPRMVNLEALEGMRGFIPINDLGIRRREVIDLLEDLAEKIVRNQTSDRRFGNREVQDSWLKLNRLIGGLFRRATASAQPPAPAQVDRSGQVLASVLQHIQGQNERLRRQLSIEAVDERALGERLLPPRRDLGEHTDTWNTLDGALRTYTYLQMQNNARRLLLQVSGAYDTLNRSLAPLAASLNVNLMDSVSGEPEDLFSGNIALNTSHHQLVCGLLALDTKAKEINSSIDEKTRECKRLGEKLKIAEGARDEAARQLEIASQKNTGTTLESEEQLRKYKEEVASLTVELEAARAELEEKGQALLALEERAASAESARDESARKLEDLTGANSELQRKIKKTEGEARDAKESVASLTEELEAARLGVEKKGQVLLALEERVRAFEAAQDDAFQKSTSHSSELEEQFRRAESEAREAKVSIASLTEELGAAKEELEQKGKKLAALEERARVAESSREDLTRQLELARKEYSSANSQLESQLRDARNDTQRARETIEQKQGEIDSLGEKIASAERRSAEKKEQLSRLSHDLKSREREIALLKETLQAAEAKREELSVFYEKAYRGLKAAEKERDEAREEVAVLEERQEEFGSFASLAKRTIEAIEQYEAKTGTVPSSIPARKIPNVEHPMSGVLLAINGLIRTIEREDSLYDSSSAESSPVKVTPARRRHTRSDSFGPDSPILASSPPQDRNGESDEF